MKSAQLKPIQVGYGDEQIIIFPRIISRAEEDIYNQRFADIADSDELKYQKEFEICLDFLGEYSIQLPEKTIIVEGKTERVPLIDGAETPTAALLEYFSDRTAVSERIVTEAYYLFKRQLNPSARFLELSAQ